MRLCTAIALCPPFTVLSAFGFRISFGLRTSAFGFTTLVPPKTSRNPKSSPPRNRLAPPPPHPSAEHHDLRSGFPSAFGLRPSDLRLWFHRKRRATPSPHPRETVWLLRPRTGTTSHMQAGHKREASARLGGCQ